MAYTVGEVAALSRVSVRALHHYDQIGLLRPSGRSPAGYRLYEGRDLERLQAILVQRALGLPLEAIRQALDDPGYDHLAALVAQRDALAQRLGELAATLALVDRTIASLQGDAPMTTPDELFRGFDPAAYEDEVQARWGDTDAYRESQRRTRAYTKEDWRAALAEGQAALDQLLRLFAAGVRADDPATRAGVEAHRAHIDRWFYPCSPAMQRALAAMYVADARFAASYDAQRPGLAQYVHDAIMAHADPGDGVL